MHIGLSATVIQNGQSGVAQYIFALTRELIELSDLNLHLFVLKHEQHHFDFAKDKCNIITVPSWARSPIKNIWWHHTKAPRIAAQLGLDVFHVPSYRRMMSSKRFATVGTIHDLAPFHVKGKYDIARMFYGRVVVKYLAARQTKLIAVSGDTAKDIEQFFSLPSSEITVIHNGIDHERFKASDSKQARKWISSTHQIHTPFFVYISRLEHPSKNHVRLIEAFNQFKQKNDSDWQLVFGGGDWHGCEEIYAAAKSSPYSQEIHFLGFIADQDLPKVYLAASSLVYPSLFEGFGLPPVEAMACGLPVISSDRGALKEIVSDAALIVDPEDISDIAEALRKVQSQPSLVAELITKAEINADRFHWKNTAEQVVRVYKEAIKKHRN
ncbi:MAG: glycosyltransferase family 1 protein [Rubritalea sp.]|uniref:glycosyltransferase family 4 protein n=1 Tax=Rubritalea sp. TaxID=2109375 RepID=UPI0032427E62